jgi:hypothetical protein
MVSPYLKKPLRSLEQACAEVAKRRRAPGPGVPDQGRAHACSSRPEAKKSANTNPAPARHPAEAA